jgi:hypothetical protein
LKSLKSHHHGGNISIKSLEDNIRNLNVNGRYLNARSNSLQQFPRSSKLNAFKELKESPGHIKKTKSDNQSFQRYFSSNQVIQKSSSSSSSSASKLKKSLYSRTNYSSPALSQSRLHHHNSINKIKSSSGHLEGSKPVTGLTSLSSLNADEIHNLTKKKSLDTNGFNLISHSNEYIGGSETRTSYCNNILDADILENIRKNHGGSSLHENIYNSLMKKNSNLYVDHIRGQKYGKKDD